MKDKIILGIDPGTTIMGYGIIKIEEGKIQLVNCGVIHLSKISDHALKLHKIFHRITSLIDEYHPDEMAIEAPFFGKNVQSMLKLGRAQGVAIAASLNRQIPYTEYAPLKIKQSITGKGSASKEQVARMLQTILRFDDLPKYLDATDGLGAAVCHHFQSGNGKLPSSGSGGWKAFLSKNPHRKIN